MLSARTIVASVDSHKLCANSRNAFQNINKIFEWIDILSYAGEKIFDPNATGAYVAVFDWVFWSGLSSTMRALPALLKLATVIKKKSFQRMDCFFASLQAWLSALFTESNNSLIFHDLSIGVSASSSLQFLLGFSAFPEHYVSIPGYRCKAFSDLGKLSLLRMF